MRCPYCGHRDSKVTDSRAMEEGIRRRRECLNCDVRFTTYERVQTMALMVGKRDGRREEFRRDKLLAGITKACAKRPIPLKDIERLVDEVEGELQSLGRAEIPSSRLGKIVMDRLKKLDRVAYIRFASVYKDFQDISSFEEVVRDLRTEALTTEEEEVMPELEVEEEATPSTAQLSFLPPGEARANTGGRGRHRRS